MSHTSSSRASTMIKLAPSPRDVPVKLSSPRSSRSFRSTSIMSETKTLNLSPRRPSTCGGKQSHQNQNGGNNNGSSRAGPDSELVHVWKEAAAELSPEMSTDADVLPSKRSLATSPKQQQQSSGGVSPARQQQQHHSAQSADPLTASTVAGEGNNNSPRTPRSSFATPLALNHARTTLPPDPAAPPTPSTPPPVTPPNAGTTRSKKMMVIDPKSGRKYHLHADDHSLTDKELHVYHRRARGGSSAKSSSKSSTAARGKAKNGGGTASSTTFSAVPGAQDRASNSDSGGGGGDQQAHHQAAAAPQAQQAGSPMVTDEGTLNTDISSFGDTLETASALTEVSYYGRYRLQSGPFQCVIPTSCRSVERMAFGDFIRPRDMDAVAEGEDDVALGIAGCKIAPERRDDVESVERGRYKHLLEEDFKAGKGPSPPMNADATAADAAPTPGKNNTRGSVKYTKYDDEGNSFNSKKIDDLHDGTQQQQTLLSPITALGSLVSPRITNLAKGFFDGNSASFVPEGGAGAVGAVEIKFRRICLVVFPDEVRRCLGGSDGNDLPRGNRRRVVGLLGMKFEQNGGDFQAHVSSVQRGSKAERMGVRKGDVVSFAVALSNMTEEQNSFLAEKLIKRLESVGMRTSYRELFDIFLSKTTNERPIGMVFRRWKNKGGGGSPRNGGNGIAPSMNIRITNEFEWSTDFLQSLSIKCREYEFEKKVPLNRMEVSEEAETEEDLPLLAFLPRPNVDTSTRNVAVSEYFASMLDSLTTRYNCGSGSSVMPSCVESTLGVSKPDGGGTPAGGKEMAADDFLSNRVLCSLVEQSMGLIFLRRTPRGREGRASSSAGIGSGFAVVRKAEGSWSAPCFLSVLGSKDKFGDGNTTDSERPQPTSSADDVKMIVIRKKELVNNLILGNTVKFIARREERANVLVRDAAIIGVQEGRFRLASEFYLAVKVNDVQNQGAYSLSTDHIEASDILIGTISPPEQSVDFYGALQSLELPYSMHSHPVIPEMLQRYSESDWCEFLPDQSSTTSSCGMRAKLQQISNGNSPEDRREIDIFARKFKYYLMDGVPVHRVLSNNNSGATEEKVIRLTIKDPLSLFSSSLDLMRKRRPGVSNVGIPSNFSTTFENITKLSRTPPVAILGNYNLDQEEKKRFFSIETDLSPGPVMMLAKSKKDAMILLCGLKLLLEREKMLSY
eukprot:CAMPEP_0172568186 /NCGR_PEP_ID=MMETSP1067-20121228/118947_1 /TAXON_ID=265564 ORGANISM="Thalassiosira punctigera, Strain Tpunct2005C2" /NCGR_SAMPLE_ID=MMETSP1067 /ASSEMBLY_ACC=CAM_ASM_000444 /LENGTH=1184 /DNA_ID=CAMNT_0013359729 /DNA_START=216 /DNA_END=3770 /DNA_ORIENTATION=+